MISDLVRWAELEPVFLKKFPSIVRISIDNMETAEILFGGDRFFIEPIQDWGHTGIKVWGPAHVRNNKLPMPV